MLPVTKIILNPVKHYSSAKEKKQKECANDLYDCECKNQIFRMAKQMQQMVKERLEGVHGETDE